MGYLYVCSDSRAFWVPLEEENEGVGQIKEAKDQARRDEEKALNDPMRKEKAARRAARTRIEGTAGSEFIVGGNDAAEDVL
eukprot:UC4_evm1s731